MNKVVSIELAGQVFWIDEQAYEVLQAYLQKIRLQLADDECADDIITDIELRISELLFGLRSNEKSAVTAAQVDSVIAQVGFLDSEDMDEKLPRRSYLDPHNKILGGVCAGLARRLSVPAFILRLVFIALTGLFGLGIALYLIFWISLGDDSNRGAALAAGGEAPTAKKIAAYREPKVNPLVQLQRIIFLPVSIIGALVSVFGSHFRKRSKGYSFIFKTIIAGALLIAAVFVFLFLYKFNQVRVFPWPVSWLLSAAAMYLTVLGLTLYGRAYYFAGSTFRLEKKLKIGALASGLMLAAAGASMIYNDLGYEHELVERSFALDDRQLSIQFNEQTPVGQHAARVRYQIRANGRDDNQLKMLIDYASGGYNKENALKNIHAIEYFFTFDSDTLTLDKYWALQEGALNRGQVVDVVIEVPQNIIVASSWSLEIDLDDLPYRYRASDRNTVSGVYFSSGQYLHEYGQRFRTKLSSNERRVLERKFCEEFFLSETWSCESNIRRHTSDNIRFDRAFQQDAESINRLREYLLPDRSLFVSNLDEMNDLVSALSVEYPGTSTFQEHIEHLLNIKSAPGPAIKSKPD